MKNTKFFFVIFAVFWNLAAYAETTCIAPSPIDSLKQLVNDSQKIVGIRGQYMASNGSAVFHSSTVIEDIHSRNPKVGGALDLQTGKIAFVVDMTKFEFDHSLMKEHFNGDDFLQTDKFPNASFVGQIQNIDRLDLSGPGTHRVNVVGKLLIHGQEKTVKVTAFINQESGGVLGKAKFAIHLKDYGVKIPFIQQAMISPDIQIDVAINFKPVKSKK